VTELRFEIPDELVDAIAERVAERLERPSENWLDVDQAAAYIAAPRSRVYDLVAQERVECRRDGRRVLFRRQWLDDALGGTEATK
jgi:excisionase family DNA binding protein